MLYPNCVVLTFLTDKKNASYFILFVFMSNHFLKIKKLKKHVFIFIHKFVLLVYTVI